MSSRQPLPRAATACALILSLLASCRTPPPPAGEWSQFVGVKTLSYSTPGQLTLRFPRAAACSVAVRSAEGQTRGVAREVVGPCTTTLSLDAHDRVVLRSAAAVSVHSVWSPR